MPVLRKRRFSRARPPGFRYGFCCDISASAATSVISADHFSPRRNIILCSHFARKKTGRICRNQVGSRWIARFTPRNRFRATIIRVVPIRGKCKKAAYVEKNPAFPRRFLEISRSDAYFISQSGYFTPDCIWKACLCPNSCLQMLIRPCTPLRARSGTAIVLHSSEKLATFAAIQL